MISPGEGEAGVGLERGMYWLGGEVGRGGRSGTGEGRLKLGEEGAAGRGEEETTTSLGRRGGWGGKEGLLAGGGREIGGWVEAGRHCRSGIRAGSTHLVWLLLRDTQKETLAW